MIFEDAESFQAKLIKGQALAGLDYGTKSLGVAISDRLLTVASPRETIRGEKFTKRAEALEAILAGEDVCGMVLGMPLNMDGSEGPRAQATRAFARNLLGRIELPILLWDERLSSVAAERAMLEADMSRSKRSEAIDHVAAGFILQGALDRLRHISQE